MMLSLLLGFAILMVSKLTQGGVLMLNQDTWGKAEQCKELIMQHFLTLGKSQFDPEVVKNCINFLRKEGAEHHENHSFGGVKSKAYINKLVSSITTRPDLEKPKVIFNEKLDKSEVTDKNIQKDSKVSPKNEKLSDELNNTLMSKDSESIPPKDDDPVEMYPENIVQEWPAVEMIRRKRSTGGEDAAEVEPSSKKDANTALERIPIEKSISQDELQNLAQEDSQETSESDESPEKPMYPFLGRDYKPAPQKSTDLLDIYPEKPVPELPEVVMTRKKRGTGTQEASSVRATTKMDPNPVGLAKRPPWEEHSLKDDMELDERAGVNRPQTKCQLITFYYNRFINWLRSHFRR